MKYKGKLYSPTTATRLSHYGHIPTILTRRDERAKVRSGPWQTTTISFTSIMSLSLPQFDESSGWDAPPIQTDDVVTAAIKKEKIIKYVFTVQL